jgi:SanA protein
MSRISRTRRIVLFWTAAALVAAVEAVLAAAFLVGEASPYVYSSVNDIPARKVGVVLGTPEYSKGKANPVLEGRIRAAAELYRAGKVQLLVVSGASRPEMFYDEISAMSKKLIAQGIPEDAIIKDGKGFRTLDSILRMRDVFGYDEFVTISQRDHCERALYLANHHGISTIGFAAGIPPGQNLDEILFSAFREPLARIKAVLDIAVNRTAEYPTER